ncbi:SCP-like protein [Necator americanus]|uniref:SCP-like protein n=1 Tax=Necator americanus TaxID=51031 RepID=W2T1M8_NECAM|nr:SCP-like protein [Necator americanus]ETN75474.1 SCP-like protein [Necator americanus]
MKRKKRSRIGGINLPLNKKTIPIKEKYILRIDEHVGKDLYTPSSTGCTCTDCIDDLCPSTFSPALMYSTVCYMCSSSTLKRLVATGWAADRKITYAKPAKTMMELTYDQALEDAAIAYLNKTDDCPTTPEDKNYVGENFWISTYSLPSEKTVEKAVGEWFAYLGNEGLGKNLDYSSLKTDSAKKLGNVIHDKTEKIGCAFKACEKSGAIVIDCRYEPKLSGGKIYETGIKSCACDSINKRCSPLGGVCVA